MSGWMRTIRQPIDLRIFLTNERSIFGKLRAPPRIVQSQVSRQQRPSANLDTSVAPPETSQLPRHEDRLTVAIPKRYKPLLVLLATLCALRLIFFAWQFSRQSLQMDFSAFYFAGAALNSGLDPYKNHVNEHPELWDGVAEFKHSRFLYPPIVAAAMRPLARLPYQTAKTVWSFASLALVFASVLIALRIAGFKPDCTNFAWLTLVFSLIFPILMFLDRGQIDAWTLVLVYLGFWLIFRDKAEPFGGVMLSLAAFLKLHCFFLLPLLLVARRTRAAIGMAIGAVLILVLQLIVCGLPITKQYFVHELPRISRYGQEGTAEMRIDSPFIRSTHENLGPNETLAGGKFRYKITAMPNAIAVASISLYVKGALGILHLPAPMSLVSCAIFAVLLLVLWRVLPSTGITGRWNALAFVNLCLIIILLSAPMTWVANLVWLVPLAVLMLFGPDLAPDAPRCRRIIATAGMLGFLLLILPDGQSFPLLLPVSAAGLHGGLIDKLFAVLVRMQFPIALILLLPYLLKVSADSPNDPASV